MDKFEQKLQQISEKARKRHDQELAEARRLQARGQQVLAESRRIFELTARHIDEELYQPLVTEVDESDTEATVRLACTVQGQPHYISVAIHTHGQYLVMSDSVAPPMESVDAFTGKKLESAILHWLGAIQ